MTQTCPPITARGVVGTALAIYRRRVLVVVAMALLVFSLLAGTESLIELVIARRATDGGGSRAVDAGFWVVSGLWTFGSALFCGLCDTIVASELGRAELPLRQAWKQLPYRRLIGLDIVITIIVSIGMVVFVVPGVVVFTLTCIAAPLAVIERRGVWESMARSAQLVRPRFALALGVVTVPVLVEHEAIHAIETLADLPFLPLVALNYAGVLLILVPVTLTEIVLAHALIGESVELVAD